MAEIIEVLINDEPIFFETVDTYISETSEVGGPDVSSKLVISYEKALRTIKALAVSTVESVQAFDKKITPDEFKLEFGIKLSGEYGAVVTKVAGEASIVVTLTYKHSEKKVETP